jgi:hypothetical protein
MAGEALFLQDFAEGFALRGRKLFVVKGLAKQLFEFSHRISVWGSEWL